MRCKIKYAGDGKVTSRVYSDSAGLKRQKSTSSTPPAIPFLSIIDARDTGNRAGSHPYQDSTIH